VELGERSKEGGKYALKSLETAVKDLASNKVDVLVTAPIDKKAIQSEDFDFPGHTEYLAKMSNADDALMLMVSEDLRVGVVTGHIPLQDVAKTVTKEKIIDKIDQINASLLKDFGIPNGKIAVLGLNPHAGEKGLLGDEEDKVIIPAIKEASKNGAQVHGPYPADGFFGSSSYKKFDAILAMYHDQGLIPFKAMTFGFGVNFTAGLPIVRTSPDHGTAFEIAGKNLANEGSFRHAIYLAVDVYAKRQEYKEMSANPLKVKSNA
jgi:4-hydroxythreonine-4-phosphate dehydrogenase